MPGVGRLWPSGDDDNGEDHFDDDKNDGIQDNDKEEEEEGEHVFEMAMMMRRILSIK